MEPALKQRLIGAAVLVAIAVIFLPMLIKGPAPESGVSDIPLDLPSAPKGGFETRELPLVTPGGAGGSSVTGLGASPGDAGQAGSALPTVDTRSANEDAADLAEPGAGAGGGTMQPPTTAAGDYAVSFGSYASTGDAQRVIEALRSAQLPGYQEATTGNGRTLYRVRIGPYESRAAAEAARLRAGQVRDDVGAKVVVLDAAAADTASASRPAALATPAVSRPTPLPESAPAQKPVATRPVDKPVVEKPATPPAATPPVTRPEQSAATPAATPAPTPAPTPAAANVGFAVQLGAFANRADADALRDRARSLGLSAFVEQVRTGDGKTLNRVQVGPVADRAAADQLKAQAAGKLGISGFVHPHP